MTFYKYQGAGNDFLIADNRDGSIQLNTSEITRLCDRHYGIGADGIMLLENSDLYKFKMVYYNSDGSGGMMCGNGGRCIVAFAADLGFKEFDFEAADGFHTAEVVENHGNSKIVRLKMKNVSQIMQENANSWFIDTGTRHAVRFSDCVADIDVEKEGRLVRNNAAYAPEGVNANFAQISETGEQAPLLRVRTYEKGVEAETCACGTGITACAIAAFLKTPEIWNRNAEEMTTINVAALNDRLSVDFRQVGDRDFRDVWLTGPAVKVAEVRVCGD